ncbi:MAG: OsmC family protein [Pseudomonadales bacterium]|nr:OsmC family protein [Pseudomonadales bacterium]
MQGFPHHYAVTATLGDDGVALKSAGLPGLMTNAPAEFDGPGDQWSPETLLVGAIADCFILTFKAVAAASKLDYQSIQCEVTGTLDRVDKQTRFTSVTVAPTVTIRQEADREKAVKLLHKTEENCLITNSMAVEVLLEAVVDCVS